MASTTDYDSDLAGDTLTATAKKKQTSFDQTNLPAQYQQPAAAPAATSTPAGPVGRAALQLPETSVTATAPTAAPTQSLESLRPTGIGDGRSAIYAGVGANGEASFSNLGSTLNTVSKNFTAPNQAPDQRLSTMPGLNPSGVGVQQSAQRYPTSLTDLSPAGPSTVNAAQPTQRTASLTDALPGYTPTTTQSSVAQPQANLAEAWRGGASSGPGFAALGSSANMGDGVGTFSQANQGDAALAMGRFQRASDLRQGYKDQDRLDAALAANTRANNTTIVRDSSRPITRADVYRDQQDQAAAQGRLDNITSAQDAINGRQQSRGTEQVLQRNARLEDALIAATAPGATDAAKQRYQALIDPTGANAQARRMADAKLAETEASTRKITAETNALGGPAKLTEGQSKDYNYYERGNAANGELASNGNALTGTVDSLIRGIPVIGQSGVGNTLVSSERQKAEQSASEFINAILRKDSGAALTKEEQEIYGKTYLPQPGDSQEVLQQKANARTRALKGIQGGLGNVASMTSPLNQGGSNAPAGNQVPNNLPLRVKGHEDVQGLPSGTLFIGPDGKTRRIP